MRRLVICAICTLFCLHFAYADKIITRTADIIDCHVVKISGNLIKYRLTHENFDREISAADIFKIKYDNGEEETFSAAKTQEQTIEKKENGFTKTAPDWSSMPEASKVYNVGDWYSENGVEGVVVWTTPNGRHGRVVHKKVLCKSMFKRPAAFFTGPVDIPLGTTDLINGYANMLKIKEFASRNHYAVDAFPVLKMISALGDGWYLPAVNELYYFYDMLYSEIVYHGDNPQFKGKTVRWLKIFDDVSKKHGGTGYGYEISLSSTEVYSRGGATSAYQAMYGDPKDPQYVLYKVEKSLEKTIICLEIIRNKGFVPFMAFHLF